VLTSLSGFSNQTDIEMIYSKASLSMIDNIELFEKKFYMSDSATSKDAEDISRR